MSILIHQEHPLGVVTESAGYSGNTASLRGVLQQVLVKPSTISTMYDFSLTNDQNDRIYYHSDITGTLNEELALPISGVYTMTIANATRNESFTILLGVRER